MKKIFQRLIHGIPKIYKNVWYNQTLWIEERKYPVVSREGIDYVSPRIGLLVEMGRTKKNKKIYYKIVKMWKTKGSDWTYDSDAYNCNLEFHSIEK